MGINGGAFLAPLVCGAFLAESQMFRDILGKMGMSPNQAWHFAFGAAAVGMGFGLIQYTAGRRFLGTAGLHPTPPKDQVEAGRNRAILSAVLLVFIGVPAIIGSLAAAGQIALTPEGVGKVFDILMPATAVVVIAALIAFGAQNDEERRRMVVVGILFVAAAVFWACFEQAGSTLTLFAKRHTKLEFLGIGFGATTFQSLNSLFVVLLAPLFATLWIALGKKNREPATMVKFAIGMFGVGLGFFVLVPAAKIVMGGNLASPLWLGSLYLIHTCGELCLSPVGLSSMTKLAPVRLGGLIMGVWFLAASMGNYMAGRAVSLTKGMAMDDFFLFMTGFPIVIGLILLVLAKPVQRMLAKSNEGVGSTPAH
jgi:POT family proton-dependent oligopeptide transporter